MSGFFFSIFFTKPVDTGGFWESFCPLDTRYVSSTQFFSKDKPSRCQFEFVPICAHPNDKGVVGRHTQHFVKNYKQTSSLAAAAGQQNI